MTQPMNDANHRRFLKSNLWSDSGPVNYVQVAGESWTRKVSRRLCTAVSHAKHVDDPCFTLFHEWYMTKTNHLRADSSLS